MQIPPVYWRLIVIQIARTLLKEDHHTYSVNDDQPTLLKQMASHWPASQRWNSQYFREFFGHCSVALSQYSTAPALKHRDKQRVTLSAYLDVVEHFLPEDSQINLDSYVAGWHFLKNAPELLADILIPDPFKNNLLSRIDREVINFDSISLFIGHSRVETPLHTDSFAVCVWLANIVGRKIIRVIPPIDYKNIYNGLDAFDEKNVAKLAELGIPVIEATIEAGDVFTIPPGYWHQVRNQGFTVAVSTNFMSKFHFLTYEQQLKAKILAPYLKLQKLKREVLGEQILDHSANCLRHFNFVENEYKFLSYLNNELEKDRKLVESAKRLLNEYV
jgi:hypothetical protein